MDSHQDKARNNEWIPAAHQGGYIPRSVHRHVPVLTAKGGGRLTERPKHQLGGCWQFLEQQQRLRVPRGKGPRAAGKWGEETEMVSNISRLQPWGSRLLHHNQAIPGFSWLGKTAKSKDNGPFVGPRGSPTAFDALG